MSKWQLTREEQRRVIADITRYRTMCLVHRFLYYVRAAPLIGDTDYDMRERKLKALVEAHPELADKAPFANICPTRVPGSDIAEDYPRRIEQLADSLSAHAGRFKDV